VVQGDRRARVNKHEFLPPESFLNWYEELVHQVYLHDDGEEQEPRHYLKRRGAKIPVRDYKAYNLLRSVDRQLYEQRRRIERLLTHRDEQYFMSTTYPDKMSANG